MEPRRWLRSWTLLTALCLSLAALGDARGGDGPPRRRRGNRRGANENIRLIDGSRTTASLSYEEKVEPPKIKRGRGIVGRLNEVTRRIETAGMGGMKHASLGVPLQLYLEENKRDNSKVLRLRVGEKNLQIDDGMPDGSKAAVRRDAAQVMRLLPAWRQDVTPEMQQRMDREGALTIRIIEPFAGLQKLRGREVLLTLVEPINVRSADLEGMIRMLYRRLQQLCVIKQRLGNVVNRLRNNAGDFNRMDNAPTDLIALADFLGAFAAALEDASGDTNTLRERDRRERERLNREIATAKRQLDEYRAQIFVNRNPLRFERYPQRRGRLKPGLVNAAEHLGRIKHRIETYELNLRTMPDNRRNREARAALTRRVNEDKATVAQLEAILQDRTSSHRGYVERLEGQQRELEANIAARRTRVGQARQTLGVKRQEWSRQRPGYAAAGARLGELRRTVGQPRLNLPRWVSLPQNTADITPRKLRQAARALRDSDAAINVWKNTAGEKLMADLNELSEVDRTYAVMMGRVVDVYKASARAAVHACEVAAEEDPHSYAALKTEAERMVTLMGEADSFFSNFGGRLDHLNRILELGGGSAAGKRIIDGVKERLELVSGIAGKIKSGVEYANHALDLHKAIEQDRPLDALGKVLELTGNLAGKIPVIGQTVGQFLGFYAKAAAACQRAANQLHDRILEDEWLARYSGRRNQPEYRLYTRAQVTDAFHHGVHTDRFKQKVNRLTTILQLRRLMFLLRNADNCQRIRDRGVVRAVSGLRG